MSENGVPVSQAELGDDDRSMFADIMGHEPDDEGAQEQGEQQSHEGEQPEGDEGEEQGEQNGQERDERGRFAARQDDGKDETRPEPPRGEQQPPRNETAAERGLRGELRSERDKRQAAEAALEQFRKEQDERFKALEARIQPPQPQPQAQPVQQQEPEDPAPDMFLDPQGFASWQARQFDRRLEAANRQNEARRVEWSLQAAAGRYGDEFKQAHAAAEQGANDPVTRAAMQRVLGSADPGEALVQWHRQQRAMAEIGSDPNAYRAKMQEELRSQLMNDPEFRKQMIENLRQEAQTGNNGSPRTTTAMPPSLNGARGSSVQRGNPGDDDNSERGVFRFAMS